MTEVEEVLSRPRQEQPGRPELSHPPEQLPGGPGRSSGERRRRAHASIYDVFNMLSRQLDEPTSEMARDSQYRCPGLRRCREDQNVPAVILAKPSAGVD